MTESVRELERLLTRNGYGVSVAADMAARVYHHICYPSTGGAMTLGRLGVKPGDHYERRVKIINEAVIAAGTADAQREILRGLFGPDLIEPVLSLFQVQPARRGELDVEIARRVVDRLNEILEVDPEALRRLFSVRAFCGRGLASHPTIQVGSTNTEGVYTVGPLGILNGVCGIRENGYGYIEAVYNESGTLTHFQVSKG